MVTIFLTAMARTGRPAVHGFDRACNRPGANIFQLNQIAVHAKTIKKNPMEPTRMVIHNANLSSGVSFSAASLFMSLGGLRRLITSASDGGRAGVADEVMLMVVDFVAVRVSRIIVAVISALPAINLYIARCQSHEHLQRRHAATQAGLTL